MFSLLFGQHTIFDSRDDELIIRDPAVHLAVGEPGSLSFTIDSDHPSAAQLTKMKGILELQEDGVVIYRGRITRDTKNFDLSRNIESEGILACLNDSVIAPFNFPTDCLEDPAYQAAATSGNVIAYFLGWLLSQHNAQVTNDQQIQLGTVTVTDSNNYISRASSEYLDTWSAVHDKLAGSSLGGHLLVRYESNGTYLDYYATLPLTNTQPVEFAENLLDLVSEVDASEIYSIILPVGEDGLTIAELPDGAINADLVKSGATIYSISRVSAYGKITRVETWGDVSVATNLKSKAAARLAASGLAQTITVTAADLHFESAQTAPFRVGRMTTLTSTPHGFSATYPLMELDPDILDPANTQITLGKKMVTQTDANKAAAANTAERLDQQQMEIDKQAQDISNVLQTTTEQITSAIQNSQSIIFTALENYTRTGDLESYKSQVSTQFAQTASQIELSFRTATEQIASVNGDLQAKYNERMKYIRFVNGDIILGEEGNEITLTIENDRMTFSQNGHEVAWFSNNMLHVTDAEFTNAAQIGTFAFVPGNGGNLSFRKVGG